MMKLIVEIDHDTTSIQFDEEGTMMIFRNLKKVPALTKDQLVLYFKGRELAQQMLEVWQKNALKTAGLFEEQKIAVNRYPIVARHQERLFELLTTFGFENKKVKAKPAKAQHRWNKQVSEIPFYIDYNNAKGEVIWQKRN